tara:strand:- start:254 stop:373 length:120 start_codon:yes stop_codon:yes gene_type:complete
MNIIGEKCKKKQESQGVNIQLKRHPKFVLFKKGESAILC